MEHQECNLHSRSESPTTTDDSSLPEIVIPSEWFPSRTSGSEDLYSGYCCSDTCSTCNWDGTRSTLLHFVSTGDVKLSDLRRSNCVCCRFLLVAAEGALKRWDEQLSLEYGSSCSSDSEMTDTEMADIEVADIEMIRIERPETETPDANSSDIGLSDADSHYPAINSSHSYLMPASMSNLPQQKVMALQRSEDYGPNDGIEYYVFVPSGEQRRENPFGLPTKMIKCDQLSVVSSALWVKQKLDVCLTTHKECSLLREESFLPTRLIDLRPFGKTGNVKLTERSNVPSGSQYAALSYVWGDPELQQQSKTTRPTLKNRLQEVVFSSLPNTIQEAIIFTRNLGLDFLWVDSICVVQNDHDEWIREAGLMYEVYKNCLVMLGGLWSDDCASGLFETGDEWQSQPIATLRLGEETWPIHVSREHEVVQLNYEWSQLREPALLGRAWCFQERMVSPRCVFFGRGELIFACQGEVSCECGIKYGTITRPPSAHDALSLSQDREPLRQRSGSSSPAPSTTRHGLRWVCQDAPKAWREVVEAYSKLPLTVKSERLFAISAVAKQMSLARPGDTYLAGLWTNTLLIDLCWWIHSGSWDYGEEQVDIPAAPTWSWARRGKQVYYRGAEDITPTAEVVDVSCENENGDPFGPVLNTKLVLRGRIMSWWSEDSAERTTEGNRKTDWNAFYGYKGTVINFRNVYEDGVFWDLIPQGTFLFEVGHFAGDDSVRVFLVLKLQDEAGLVFSREAIIHPRARAVDDGEDGEQFREFSRIFREHSSVKECTII